MHYEINVALNGRHFFATHERSLTTQGQCQAVYDRLVVAFPASEGYEISVSRHANVMERVNMSATDSGAGIWPGR